MLLRATYLVDMYSQTGVVFRFGQAERDGDVMMQDTAYGSGEKYVVFNAGWLMTKKAAFRSSAAQAH